MEFHGLGLRHESRPHLHRSAGGDGLAQRIVSMTKQEDPLSLDTMAAALAVSGRFPEAVEAAEGRHTRKYESQEVPGRRHFAANQGVSAGETLPLQAGRPRSAVTCHGDGLESRWSPGFSRHPRGNSG